MLPDNEIVPVLNLVPVAANREIDRCFTTSQFNDFYGYMTPASIRQYKALDHSTNCRSIFAHLWDIVVHDQLGEDEVREIMFALWLHRWTSPENNIPHFVSTTAVRHAYWAIRQLQIVELRIDDLTNRGTRDVRWFRVAFREDLS